MMSLVHKLVLLSERSERKGLVLPKRNSGKIELELSDYLGIKVDLLTEKSISPYLIDGIRKDAKVISK